jgi:arsenate reductase (thioredoxin)
MKKVLFLCTGNSCRSQMAEAIVNQRVEGWQAFSAGTKPAGYVHPKALQVLEETGITHSGSSKHVDELRELEFDLVVTVCDSAAEECPLWLGKGKRIHSSFSDPAKAEGSQDEILGKFRRVRDEIMKRIPAVIEGFTDD